MRAFTNRITETLARYLPEFLLRLAGQSITETKYRQVRATILHEQAKRLARCMKTIGFKQQIFVDASGSLHVASGGIFLDCRGTNRYLKVCGPRGNEGAPMLDMLRSHGIVPRSVLDLGANYGEISLFFVRNLPECRIVAVEASLENFEILKENIEFQFFNTTSLRFLHLAVADKAGTVRISTGLGSENSIMQNQDKGTDVAAVTLDMLLDEHFPDGVDFIKVDIEGAEPLLGPAINRNAKRIKAMLLEFSYKNTTKAYLELLNTLYASGFRCFMDTGGAALDLASVHSLLKDGADKRQVLDLWFLRAADH